MSSRSPSGAVKTMLPCEPDAAGSRLARVSSTCFDGVPSIVTLVEIFPPLRPIAPNTTPRTTAQAPMNTQGLL